MKTAIVTDSAAYLPPKLTDEYDITVVPITVIFDNQAYLENIDMDSPTFFDRMRNESVLPTTAQITMAQMQATYDKLADEGYDEVISIHLSSGITSFFDNLSMFVQDYDRLKVFPFDSKIASAGEGNMALMAAQMVRNGFNASQIMPKLADLRDSTHALFIVDDLKHLLRTGRISNSSAFVGNLLRIKPILTFNDAGQIVAIGKERTMKKAFKKTFSDFEIETKDTDYPIRATTIDANNPDANITWQAEFKDEFPGVPVNSSHIGPVISVHTGENTMGLIWAKDWRELAKK